MSTQTQTPELDRAKVHDSVAGYISAAAGMAGAVRATAELLTDRPTFDHWEAVRRAWTAEYKAQRNCDDSAARQAWIDMAKRLNTAYSLTKPASPNPDATRQAKSRGKRAEALAELAKKHGGIAGLRAEAVKLADAARKARSPEDQRRALAAVAELTEAMTAADKEAQAAAKAKQAAAMKDARDKLKVALDGMTPEQVAQVAAAAQAIRAGKKVTVE